MGKKNKRKNVVQKHSIQSVFSSSLLLFFSRKGKEKKEKRIKIQIIKWERQKEREKERK